MSEYSDVVLADSPLGYWRLGETSGTNANDETVNNRDGTYTGAVTLNGMPLISGDTDPALVLSASGQYVNIPSTGLIDTADFSVELWFRPVHPPLSTSAFMSIISANDSSNITWALRWRADAATGDRDLDFHTRTTVSDSLQVQNVLQYGEILHIVGTWDGTTKKLYINGRLVASVALSGTLNVASGHASVTVGCARNSGGTVINPCSGQYDEVAIYGSALTAARVAAHYAAGKTPASFLPYDTEVLADSPWGYWPIYEDEGPTIKDYASTHDLTVDGDGAQFHRAGLPDGTVAGIYLPVSGGAHAASADNFTASTFSAEMWVLTQSATNTSECYPLFSFSDAFDGVAFDRGLRLQAGNNQVLTFDKYIDAVTAGLELAASNDSLNRMIARWHHVVVTSEPSATKLYVDGVEKATTAVDLTSSPTGKKVILGGGVDVEAAPPAIENYAGRRGNLILARFALYTTVLSAARVKNHFLAGRAGVGTNRVFIPDELSAGGTTITWDVTFDRDMILTSMAGIHTLTFINLFIDGVQKWSNVHAGDSTNKQPTTLTGEPIYLTAGTHEFKLVGQAGSAYVAAVKAGVALPPLAAGAISSWGVTDEFPTRYAGGVWNFINPGTVPEETGSGVILTTTTDYEHPNIDGTLEAIMNSAVESDFTTDYEHPNIDGTLDAVMNSAVVVRLGPLGQISIELDEVYIEEGLYNA